MKNKFLQIVCYILVLIPVVLASCGYFIFVYNDIGFDFKPECLFIWAYAISAYLVFLFCAVFFNSWICEDLFYS